MIVAVVEDARGKGLGAWLVEALASKAAERYDARTTFPPPVWIAASVLVWRSLSWSGFFKSASVQS